MSKTRKILSVKERNQLKIEHKEYNKRWRTRYLHAMQMDLDDYIDYIQGYYHAVGEKTNARRAVLPKIRETKYIPSYKGTSTIVPGVTHTWSDAQERVEISKSYTIVPAYNKGPYMVVPKSELHTAGKKN
tara:strand:- start:692 stop:1081 length:390 start_codon:yes stop_codon:yes gene_type:complete